MKKFIHNPMKAREREAENENSTNKFNKKKNMGKFAFNNKH
jgi:hypothetical protein